MNLKELTTKINKTVDELDFGAARIFLEENLEFLKDHKNLLNSNARAILDFLVAMEEEGVQQLTRKDMSIINAINSYASKFDVRGLKILVKDYPHLFMRSDITSYLNSDAKIILEGMGSIHK